MEKPKKGKNFYLVFSVMGLLISLAVCTMMYFQFRNHTEESYFSTLKNVAVMIEKNYPIIYDIDSLKKGFRNNEDWAWELHSQWMNILNAFDLAYIYYAERAPDGEFLEIMDTAYERDADEGWLGSEVWENDAVPAEIEQAWITQKLVYSEEPSVEEEWGTVVSVYYPIVENGNTLAVLGVDYDISYVNALNNRILFFLIITFLVAAALTGALAFIGSRSVLITIEEKEKITREAVERQMEIEKLMDSLKKSSEARTAFLSDISNSMADPINHIIRLSSSLSKFTEITDDHQKNLEIINDEGLKLFAVINDILDILKIEAGKLKFNPVKYKLPKLISEVTTAYLIYIEDKPLAYKVVVDENLPVNLFGDELRIKQICHHLLTNAFKYTDKGSITVKISSAHKSGYELLVIKIIDTGIGMTEKKVSDIFANYGQESGTGKLGLFLCKQLAELMKGKLSVNSEYGKGSVFTLAVPQKLLSNETITPEIAKKLNSLQAD